MTSMKLFSLCSQESYKEEGSFFPFPETDRRINYTPNITVISPNQDKARVYFLPH